MSRRNRHADLLFDHATFELMNRNVDQPYKFVATWAIDEWSKIGLKVTQRVLPTGPFYDALRTGAFEVAVEFNCQNMVNPLLDVAKVLPRSVYPENYGGYEDPKLIEIYNSMLRETDPAKQRAKMREFEIYALDTQVDTIMTPWWSRIIVQRSYMKGWKRSAMRRFWARLTATATCGTHALPMQNSDRARMNSEATCAEAKSSRPK